MRKTDNTLFAACAAFLLFLIILVLLKVTSDAPEQRYVLLSFDVEPIDGKGNVTDLLEILERNGARGTFFVTGEYAEQNPGIVRLLKGHEVGSHSYTHPVMSRISKEEQREEIVRSRDLLSQLSGSDIVGYRSPYHRMNKETLDVLEEEGFLYDATIITGISTAFPSVRGRSIGEIPVSSVFGIPIEDVIWTYYLHMPRAYFYVLKHKTSPVDSFLFHPREIMKHPQEFEEFIKFLKQRNVMFISHRELIIRQHEGV